MKKKRIVIITSSVLAVVIIIGIIAAVMIGNRNSVPVEVTPVSYISTNYWDSTTMYGNVSSDYKQQLFPDGTKIISKIFVKEGDKVKKGDPLVEYDRTKLELEEQSAALEIQKTDRKLAVVQSELNTLYNTSPYVPPPPVIEPTPTPIPESKAVLYDRLTPDSVPFAGSGTTDDPYRFLCTEDCSLSPEFIQALMGLKSPVSSASSEPTAEPSASPSSAPEDSPTPTPEPTPSPEPTVSSEPTPTPTPTPEPIESSSLSIQRNISRNIKGTLSIGLLNATLPGLTQDQSGAFAAVFEVYEEDNENGTLRYAWKLDGTKNDGGFTFPEQDNTDDNGDTPVVFSSDLGGYIDSGTAMYSQEELNALIKEKKAELVQLQYDSKQNTINHNKAKLELENATVLSTMDGTVIKLTDIDTAMSNAEAFLEVSGSEGVFVTGTVNESLLGSVSAGTEISANSWETGQVYSGKILEISKYPTDGGYGSMNPNTSDYSFSAYLDGAEALSEGAGLDISVGSESFSDAIYLQAAYIRSDDGGKYVYKDEDGKLKKIYISTGQSIYSGEYIELKGGLSSEDKVAFPYGNNLRDGAPTKEMDQGVMY